MRVSLSQNDLKRLFGAVLDKLGSWTKVSNVLGVSVRNINDWRRGVTTISKESYEKLFSISKIPKEHLVPKVIPNYWHAKKAGLKGAMARMRIYGNFGTTEGRKKGGLVSLITHRKLNTGFKILKLINPPQYSEKLAELMGILMGDGHLSKYQASITTNSETDLEHAFHVKKLIKELFDVTASVKIRSYEKAVVVVASSKSMVGFLWKKGMPIGNKIENNLTAPDWIMKHPVFSKSFLRGLFDTDGCIYLDKHTIKDKIYKHMGWTITSYATNLVVDILKILRELKFSPTHTVSQKSVFIRRQQEIKRYFLEVGTSNPKHFERYQKFIGEVPKWS